MTTPADTHSPYPFAPRLHNPDEPKLGISDYDALADLFLGEEAEDHEMDSAAAPMPIASSTDREPESHPDRDHRAQSRTPKIEALLVGHLPVRASFWVTQHARAVADETGQTVAVLRMIAGDVSIDLLAPSSTKRSFTTIDARSMSDALAVAGRAASHWMIVVDELAEADIITSPDLDRITLLTSANHPAVLNAYQTLKRMLGVIDTTNPPELGVVLLGSSAEDADRTVRQIRHAASTFLSTPIEVCVGPERIDATRAVPIYRGKAIDDYSAMEMVRCATDLADSLPADDPSSSSRVERTVKASREPQPVTERSVLARYIEGLDPLSLTCPIEPTVQLALDADSRIHLLATGDGPDPVRSLTQAGAWASLNRELILAAAQRSTADTRENPVLHLLVDDVPNNRRLLDAPIRVHLLRAVPVQNAEPVWFSAPLN